MDKKINIDLPNQHYYIHVPAQGNQPLFSSVFAYDALLNSLNEQTSIELLGYCFLPDSIHLLVFSHTAPTQWLDACLMKYNQWHQSASGASGYIFADEKKQQTLIQPRFLSKALKYLHNIPVSQKMCSRPDQFLYSSFHDYMGNQNTGVVTHRILAALSPHNGQRIRRFEDYMLAAKSSNEITLPLGNNDFYAAYADTAYITKIMSNYALNLNPDSEQHHLEIWQSCLSALSEATDLDFPTLLGKRRHHSLPDAHFLLVWLYIEEAKGQMYIAAKQLGMDEITLKLNINSIQLHHPEAYLRYIASHWHTHSKVA